MTATEQTRMEEWTRIQALGLAALCLAAGIGGGWTIRAWRSQTGPTPTQSSSASSPASSGNGPSAQQASVNRVKQAADAQAAPLLEKLKSDPGNADLLTSTGNVYYDAQQYPVAIDYYARVLKIKPSDTAVRTDLGTAYWYIGNADAAIDEFNKALAYAPNNPNTLFNLGLVQWKGKLDAVAAIANWQKLLATNPAYEEKDKVQQMIREAKNQSSN